MKNKLIIAMIVFSCILAFCVVPAIAGNDKGGVDVKTPAQKADDKLQEHKEKKIIEQKKNHNAQDFNRKVPGMGNIRFKDNKVPDGFEQKEEPVTAASWKDKGKIHIRDTKHHVTDVQIPWGELQEIDGFDGRHVRVTHFDDDGNVNAKWIQKVHNKGGYAYLEDVPFSTVVVSGFTGTYTKALSETITVNTTNSDGIYTENLGQSFDAENVSFLNMTVTEFNVTGAVIGFEWDTSDDSPNVRSVDVDGNTLEDFNFDAHPVWGNMRRCVIDPDTGDITYGDNARGDGLTLNGTDGNVMVEIPRFYVKFENTSVFRGWWISPYNLSDYGFELHPAFRMRGGTEVDALYISAYEASGFDDAGTFELQSATNKPPVTGEVAYPDLPNSGHFDIDEAELYANNIGDGYGTMNIWTMSAIRLLFYTEMGSLNSQTALGRGVVDLASGTDFAGVNTGADSADTNIGTNGTGTGTGTDGETPIVYRGLENMWGNVWQFVIGYNAVDAEYRITPRDGTGALAGDLAAGEYEVSIIEPILSDGYQSDVETENLLQYLLIGSETAGSSSTYLCDYFYGHDAGETNILLSSGFWTDGSYAGVGSLRSNYGSSDSVRNVGARFEFIPQLAENATEIDTTDSNIQVKSNSNSTYSTELDETGTVSIPYESTDSNIETVDIRSDLFANLVAEIEVGYTDDTYIIEEFFDEGLYIDEYAVEIEHVPSATMDSGTITYNPTDSIGNGIMEKNWDYNLESNNPNATITTFNVDSLIIDTGPVTAGTTYTYTVTAETTDETPPTTTVESFTAPFEFAGLLPLVLIGGAILGSLVGVAYGRFESKDALYAVSASVLISVMLYIGIAVINALFNV